MLSRKLVNPLPQTFWGLFFPVTSSAGSVCTFPPYFLAQRVTITQASRAASVPAAMPQAWRTVTARKGCRPGGGGAQVYPCPWRRSSPAHSSFWQVPPAPLSVATLPRSELRPSVYIYYKKGESQPAVCHGSDNYIPNSHHAVCC